MAFRMPGEFEPMTGGLIRSPLGIPYDLIAETRLEHQARRVKAGDAPDNYLLLSDLSDFERSHLRDAFVVVKTMQSALVSGRAYCLSGSNTSGQQNPGYENAGRV